MTLNSIEQFFIMYSPLILSILMQVITVTGILTKFKSLISAVKKDDRLSELEKLVKEIVEINYKLQQDNKELKEVITKIKRNE